MVAAYFRKIFWQNLELNFIYLLYGMIIYLFIYYIYLIYINTVAAAA